jgi:hypothetical protein
MYLVVHTELDDFDISKLKWSLHKLNGNVIKKSNVIRLSEVNSLFVLLEG